MFVRSFCSFPLGWGVGQGACFHIHFREFVGGPDFLVRFRCIFEEWINRIEVSWSYVAAGRRDVFNLFRFDRPSPRFRAFGLSWFLQERIDVVVLGALSLVFSGNVFLCLRVFFVCNCVGVAL